MIALVNNALTRLISSSAPPALDLAGIIPEQCRTLVAVPVLLSTRAELDERLADLESQYLAAARGELYFALLADYADSLTEVGPDDQELSAAGRAGVAELNRRYGAGKAGARFMWLHRARRWNAAQQRWMGWERKRGKLHELNRLLRGSTDTSFALTAPEYAQLPRQVRYVLVLDEDTQLPHGAAEKLIAKMAHPLNQATFDPQTQRVVTGYGILQPRVIPALPGPHGLSLVQSILAGSPGLDPYAFAVSDVYQDLFGEGSFTGKGLYDIDAFEASLAGRIRENSVLSHDLLEGLYARSGVACDVAVVEAAPERYDVVARREHRWTRGDWQLLPWLRPMFAVAASRRSIESVSALGHWKLIDNLRRTLIPLTTLGALVCGWLLPMPWAARWTALILMLLGVPPLLPIVMAVRDRPRHLRRESERRALSHDLRIACLRWTFTAAMLADRAWWMADAIVRTLVRLGLTRRRLLDWTTAAQARIDSRLELRSYLRNMRGGVMLSAGVALLLALAVPENFWIAAPWLLLWFTAPVLARQASLPHIERSGAQLAPADTVYLRLIARRTWWFFEHFVTPENHHLPPDNFQETPLPVVAQRTSPTNIGMYLLSTVAAVEFGWLGLLDWADRLEATFATLAKLERYRGHFLNWYDTRTTQPLLPSYVSTVDSGNLAGHLLALANAIDWITQRPLWGVERVSGINDALQLANPGARRELLITAATLTSPAADRVCATVRAVIAASPSVQTEDISEAADWLALSGDCARSHGRDLDALGTPHPATESSALAQPTLLGLTESDGATAYLSAARELARRLAEVARCAREFAYAMNFTFLLKPHRMLLSIGFNVAESRLDTSDYDLLASEARLASFIAIAKRDVPARHWFRLDRRSVAIGNRTTLLSWSGSMFEYLMPALVMRAPAGSLLGRSERVALRAQRHYAAALDLPWGISESAHNTRDLDQTYQYSPFGVPALGLKRGLANDLVIAPYATGLAAMIDPAAAAANFRALSAWGALGHYGFYEALDFTPGRLPEEETVAVVRCLHGGHHQGMTIVAIANALLGRGDSGVFSPPRRPPAPPSCFCRKSRRVRSRSALRDLRPRPRRLASPCRLVDGA